MLAAVGAASVALGGCGSQEASVVERAMSAQVESAQVAMRLSVTAAGKPAGSFSLTGPMRSNGRAGLASFDWRVRAGAGSEQIRARVISSGSNVFVVYGGRTYAVGERKIARLNRQAARQQKRGATVDSTKDLARLGVDLEKWFPQSGGDAQDSEVAGVATRKVSGRLDVSAALQDILRLARRPEFRAQLGGQVPELDARDLRMVDALITDPRFVLEAGRDDGKLRRLTTRFGFQDPGSGARGTVRFALQLSDVDEPVQIDAPASGRPIQQLLRRLDANGLGRGDAAVGGARKPA